MRHKLDFSPGSLDVLEAWLLARYPDGDAARAETEVVLLDGVARYIGETFRKNVGGEWWFVCTSVGCADAVLAQVVHGGNERQREKE